MPRHLATFATWTAATILLLAGIASADDMESESISLPPAAESAAALPAAAPSDAPNPGEDDGWRYCTYYILPLTRHMQDSGLPLAGRIFLYPLAAAFDVAQLPVGVLAGFAGE